MSKSKFVATFACTWIAWILFAGTFGSPITISHFGVSIYQEIVLGAVSAAIVSGISYGLFTKNPKSMLNPVRWGYLIAYVPAYVWAEIKAHLNVAYRIIHPGLPIKPALVELPTELKSDVGQTTLANSITMTPGTLTVDINQDEQKLFVHWISAESVSSEGVYNNVGKPLERFIKGGLG